MPNNLKSTSSSSSSRAKVSHSTNNKAHHHSIADTIKHKLHHVDSSRIQLIPKAIGSYTDEELIEYRQVFDMFDTDRSGAIGLDELASAMKNLGLNPNQHELESIIDDVDQIGNGEINFDDFCDVMKRVNANKQTWNEMVQECFRIFDRSEAGNISKRDFRYVLREFGDITEESIIEEIFAEADVDANGLIDYDEFAYMVRNYMSDDDILVNG